MKKSISITARFPINGIKEEKVKKTNDQLKNSKTLWERILKKLKVIKQ